MNMLRFDAGLVLIIRAYLRILDGFSPALHPC